MQIKRRQLVPQLRRENLVIENHTMRMFGGTYEGAMETVHKLAERDISRNSTYLDSNVAELVNLQREYIRARDGGETRPL